MEQLNRIEIRGYVGSVARYNGGERPMVRLTVATSVAFKDRAGAAVIETTWHNLVAWEGKNVQNTDRIEKGSRVYAVGRLRSQKYTGVDGVDRIAYEIQASKLELLSDEGPFQYEM